LRSVSISQVPYMVNAQHVAEEAKTMFETKGIKCDIFVNRSWNIRFQVKAEAVVVITRPQVKGDVPSKFRVVHSWFYATTFPLMNGKPFAVAGHLADSSYGDSFCGVDVSSELLVEHKVSQWQIC